MKLDASEKGIRHQIKNMPTSKVGQSKKLRKPWIGPFVIVFKINNVLYRIQRRKRNQVVHHDRLKLCQDRYLPLWLKRLRPRFSNQKTRRRNPNHQTKKRSNYPRPTLVEMMWHAPQRTKARRNHRWILRLAHLEGKDLLGCDRLPNGCRTFLLLITNFACIIRINVLMLFFFYFILFPFFILPLYNAFTRVI